MKKELSRLRKLADWDIDYEQQQEKLAPYVELAKYITDSPVCEINIIDAYTQWTIARTADSLKAIPREESVCHDTIQQDTTYEITDLSSSKRYQDRFYVTGKPHFRYYCGVQLTTSDGFNIGSICVLDMKSKKLNAGQKELLEYLAQCVVDHFEQESRHATLSKRFDELRNSLRNLNHDVRSPINGILGIADILKDDTQSTVTPGEGLEMIEDSAQAVIDEIDGVLNTIDNSDGSDNRLEETQLTRVPEKIKRLYNPLAKQKNHVFTIANNINTEVRIPHNFSVCLTQIIGNLVSNAMKFTPEKGSINVVFDSNKNEDKHLLDVTVGDNGRGMTDEQITSFNNGKGVTRSRGTAGEESFGVGLAHVLQLVEEQNGSITVKNNEKQGATFSLALPLPK